MNGGLVNDLMTGGFDTFDFNAVGESLPGAARDVITDFIGNGILPEDVIDVSTIDANVLLARDQAFTFIGAGTDRFRLPAVRFGTPRTHNEWRARWLDLPILGPLRCEKTRENETGDID